MIESVVRKALISIHALTRRAARFSFSSPTDSCDFNPRSHEESGLQAASVL